MYDLFDPHPCWRVGSLYSVTIKGTDAMLLRLDRKAGCYQRIINGNMIHWGLAGKTIETVQKLTGEMREQVRQTGVRDGDAGALLYSKGA